MITIAKPVAENLQKDLSLALVSMSNGKINIELAKRIAEKSVNQIDLNNSALVHKGTNWYARQIINSIAFK